MEVFEGACCSLRRHLDLLAKTKAIEEMDSRFADYYICRNLVIGDERSEDEN